MKSKENLEEIEIKQKKSINDWGKSIPKKIKMFLWIYNNNRWFSVIHDGYFRVNYANLKRNYTFKCFYIKNNYHIRFTVYVNCLGKLKVRM